MISSLFKTSTPNNFEVDEPLPEEGPDFMELTKFVTELHADRIDSLEAEQFAAFWAKYWTPVGGRRCPHRVARVSCDRSEKDHPWFTSAGLYRGERDGKLTLLTQPAELIEGDALQRFIDYASKLGLEVSWWSLKSYPPGVHTLPVYSLALAVTRQ